MTVLVWFRRDLRIEDNPALFEAAKRGSVLPVYILESGAQAAAVPSIGGAGRWWLHHSLAALKSALPGLILMQGDPRRLVPELARRSGAEAVFWNRRYEPQAIACDRDVKAALREQGLEARSFNASLLVEPWEMETKSGGPFKVYSPFWKALRQRSVMLPHPAPGRVELAGYNEGESLADLKLLPEAPNWAKGWERLWQPGEAGARQRLRKFLDQGLRGYGDLRDRPDLQKVSRLSPHLHFGEISPRQVWHATMDRSAAEDSLAGDAMKFLSEVAWREFSHHLLYHFPDLSSRNWRPAFDAYPWRDSPADLECWQRGRTGYPLVDAGMRELWQTGYMHNRVRMIAASFLVKHLRLHWRHGEAWFRDTLVDADLANNAASWQWVAGSGADAAPYFRIFNPVTQAERFDPDGRYIRRWVPELAGLETKHLFAPFNAPEEDLSRAGVKLGATYPRPLVDHARARQAALDGYEAVRRAGQNAS